MSRTAALTVRICSRTASCVRGLSGRSSLTDGGGFDDRRIRGAGRRVRCRLASSRENQRDGSGRR